MYTKSKNQIKDEEVINETEPLESEQEIDSDILEAPSDAVEIPGHIKTVSSEPKQNSMDVMQVVSHMATVPDVKVELDMLISEGLVKHVEATKTELKRLGHFVG